MQGWASWSMVRWLQALRDHSLHSSCSHRPRLGSAVLLGTPVPQSSERWLAVRRVVAGRLINGYSTKDWILRYIYRAQSFDFSVSGVGPVNIPGRSIDVSVPANHDDDAAAPASSDDEQGTEADKVPVEPPATCDATEQPATQSDDTEGGGSAAGDAHAADGSEAAAAPAPAADSAGSTPKSADPPLPPAVPAVRDEPQSHASPRSSVRAAVRAASAAGPSSAAPSPPAVPHHADEMRRRGSVVRGAGKAPPPPRLAVALENYDLSDIITQHVMYATKLKEIMARVQLK